MILNDGTVDLVVSGLGLLVLRFNVLLVWSGSVGVGVDIYHIVYTHTYYEHNCVDNLQLLF